MGVLVNGLEVVKGLPSVGGGMPAQQASSGGGLDKEGIQAQDMRENCKQRIMTPTLY